MRLFFGLKPTPQVAMEVADWRDRVLPPLRRPVPIDNLHITLAFLGDVKARQMEALLDAVDQVVSPALVLTFDEMGFWSKQKLLWLGMKTKHRQVTDLARQLTRLPHQVGLPIRKSEFLPHMTLARRCDIPPPKSTTEPEFSMDFDHFSLFESTSIKTGVRYGTIQEWDLHSWR